MHNLTITGEAGKKNAVIVTSDAASIDDVSPKSFDKLAYGKKMPLAKKATNLLSDYQKEKILESALEYAENGLRVFPLWPFIPKEIADSYGVKVSNNGKTPAIGFKEGATTNKEEIQRWFGPGGDYEGFNLAIATGDYDSAKFLIVVDIDKKNGKDGEEAITRRCKENGLEFLDYAKTRSQKTASGGYHLFVWSDRPIKQTVDAKGMLGVDVRCMGGYVVADPSTIDGNPYKMNKLPIAQLGELAKIFDTADPVKEAKAGKVLQNINHAAAETRAREYLKKKEPVAEGNRNHSAYKDANECKDYGCDIVTTKNLMAEYWKSTPPLEQEELDKVIESAYKNGQEAQGSSAPEAIFPTVELDPEAPIILSPFDQMNAEFAYMIDGGNGTGYVMWETTDQNGNSIVKELSIKGFHDMHASKTIQIGSGNRYEQLSVAWIKSDKRRSYKWAVFEPNKKLSPEFYNTWRGFAVAPVKGSWSKMRAHIRDVICGGDKELDRYVMGWLARMIQYPGLRAEVALVLRGKKGTGKGLLGTMLARIVGRYAIAIANPKLLVGNFNAHLREKIFVFADEAFFAGDKQHESVLKQMITEERIVFERKGHDAEDAHNYLHVLMASNEDWVVPATADERRFCMINVSDARREDAAYFDGIIREMESGGLAAMLYDLQKYDVSKFNVRIIPQTLALADQKISGLKGAVRWLYECLAAGQFNSTLGSGFSTTWEDKEQELPKNRIYEMYLSKSNSTYREYRPQPATVFWRDLREVFRCAGMDLLETRSKGKPDGSERIRQVVFPDLNKAREAFSIYMRANIEWDYDPS